MYIPSAYISERIYLSTVYINLVVCKIGNCFFSLNIYNDSLNNEPQN